MPRAINYPPVMGAREKFLCSSPFQGSGEVGKLFSGWCEWKTVHFPVTMEGPNPVLCQELLAQHPARFPLAPVGMGQGRGTVGMGQGTRQQGEPGPSCYPCALHGDGQAGSGPSSLPHGANSRETGASWLLGTFHSHREVYNFPCSCWALQPPQLVPTGPLNASKDVSEMLISTPGSSYCWRHTTGHGSCQI